MNSHENKDGMKRDQTWLEFGHENFNEKEKEKESLFSTCHGHSLIHLNENYMCDSITWVASFASTAVTVKKRKDDGFSNGSILHEQCLLNTRSTTKKILTRLEASLKMTRIPLFHLLILPHTTRSEGMTTPAKLELLLLDILSLWHDYDDDGRNVGWNRKQEKKPLSHM